ncbi:MAG: ABC transporter ATP-binding protein [Polyangiaceae bacterium]
MEGSTDEVVLEGIRKVFAARGEGSAHAALSGVSLRVAPGERVVIVGPSGCGKSTLLRMIAGLDDPDEGVIRVGARDLRGVAPQDRDVAMVFQGYALYPHMSAAENIAFPLKMRGASRDERARAVDAVGKVLRIGHLLGRRPGQLSGGERQRVAIGRALVRRPKVFLFDEPLSNLDAALRNDLRVELAQIFTELEGALLYVTHDQSEAMTLADRIVVMNQGRILQAATPREIYETPATAFVAGFLGSPKMNVLPAERDGDRITFGPFVVDGKAAPAALAGQRRFLIGVRPDDVHVDEAGSPAEVLAAEPLGAETVLSVRAGEATLRLRRAGFDVRRPGESLRVRVDASRLHFFAADGAQERIG